MAFEEASRSVNELSHDVGVPGMSLRVCSDVDEHVVHRYGLPPHHGTWPTASSERSVIVASANSQACRQMAMMS